MRDPLKRASVTVALICCGCLQTSTLGSDTSGSGSASTGSSGAGSTGGSPTFGDAGGMKAFPVALTVEPATLNFGYEELGSMAVQCVTVGNPAGEALTVTGLASFETAGGAFSLSPTDDASPPNPSALPVAIPGGGSAKVCFGFTPPIAQQYLGQAVFATDDTLATIPAVSLTGWGGGPQFSCVPTDISFGETLDHFPSTILVTCTNVGTAIPGDDLWLGVTFVGGGGVSASIATEPGSAPLAGLAPGQSAQIDLNLGPAPGMDGIVYLDTSLLGGNIVEWKLDENAGVNGQPPPLACSFAVAPAKLDFGSVPAGATSAPQSFAIENLGDGGCVAGGFDLPPGFEIGSLSLPESFSDAGVGSVAIPPGEALEVQVQFAPPRAGGFGGNVASVRLSGKGQ